MENTFLEIQGNLMVVREILEGCVEHQELMDHYTLGQIKVQLLDLITVTELLIVTNQARIFPSQDGQSFDHQA